MINYDTSNGVLYYIRTLSLEWRLLYVVKLLPDENVYYNMIAIHSAYHIIVCFSRFKRTSYPYYAYYIGAKYANSYESDLRTGLVTWQQQNMRKIFTTAV